jgi:hypothetical protein
VQRYTQRRCSMRPRTISEIWGCKRGSPPETETTGAPALFAAERASSTDIRRFIASRYSRTLPQPAQRKLQASKGSSMRTMGKNFPRLGHFRRGKR